MIVMEYCPNGTLLEQVRHNAMGPEYIVPKLSLKWLSQVFLGLEHLHKLKMLLRDLKPDNVVLDARKRAKLTDFGFGRFGAEAPAAWTFTFPPGTPGYVSPEVICRRRYDAKADLYSYGVLIWLVLTGGLVSTRDMVGGPIPPAGAMTTDSDYGVHERDHERLKWCIQHPSNFDARPVPTAAAQTLILALTNGVAVRRPSHTEIRADPFFSELNPPFPPPDSTNECLENWLCAHGFK